MKKKFSDRKIKKAMAVYTGGGIYVFFSILENDTYTFTDSDFLEWNLILKKNPYYDMDNCFYPEWQDENTIEELTEKEAVNLNLDICNWIIENEPKGNYLKSDIEKIRDYYLKEYK